MINPSKSLPTLIHKERQWTKETFLFYRFSRATTRAIRIKYLFQIMEN
jgi:hypothetical protein